MKLKVLGLSLAALAISAGAQAHHSFAGTYLMDAAPVTIEGKLVQFLLRNPHSYVQVEAKDPQTGEMTRWSIEWGTAGQLQQGGVSDATLQVGDHVIVTGNASRHPDDHRLRMRTIERPAADGRPAFTWKGRFN
jgi:Family of unknown function (DUF6152)